MRIRSGWLIVLWFWAWALPASAAPTPARFEQAIAAARAAMLSDPAKALQWARGAVSAAAPIADSRERLLARGGLAALQPPRDAGPSAADYVGKYLQAANPANEADVALEVVKSFTASVRERADRKSVV